MLDGHAHDRDAALSILPRQGRARGDSTAPSQPADSGIFFPVELGTSRIIIENAANWDAALSSLLFRVSEGSVTSIIKAMSDMEPRLLIIDRAIANWDAALSRPLFRGSKGSVTSIIKAMRDIKPRLLIIDRAIANARVVRRAPESIALTLIVAVGASCFAFEQFHPVGGLVQN